MSGMVRFAAGMAAAVAIHWPPRALTEGTACPEELWKMSGGEEIH